MPFHGGSEVDALSSTSGSDQVKAATSSCIASAINRGMSQEDATRFCSEAIGAQTQPQQPSLPPVGGI